MLLPHQAPRQSMTQGKANCACLDGVQLFAAFLLIVEGDPTERKANKQRKCNDCGDSLQKLTLMNKRVIGPYLFDNEAPPRCVLAKACMLG